MYGKTGISSIAWMIVSAVVMQPAFGGVLGLNFSTGGVDPLTLEVGTSFEVTVELDRQGSGLELGLLGTTVLFSDATHFDAPSDLNHGSIIPVATDVVFPPSFPGSIDVQYSNFFSGPPAISSDGDFFSYTLAPIAAGRGTLSFPLFSSYALDQNDPGNFIADFDLGTLNYTITQAVPEPSSFLAFATLGFSAVAVRRRRRPRA